MTVLQSTPCDLEQITPGLCNFIVNIIAMLASKGCKYPIINLLTLFHMH